MSEPHLPGSIEHVYVIEGALRVSPGDGSVTDLSEGDFFSFSAEIAHSYEALSAGTRGIVVMQYT
jgi:quercetin dioxygenase-like cupin family protein